MPKKQLHLHHCKLISAHELIERDSVKGAEYCLWFRDVITANREDILDVTFFADEALFHFSGYVNNQNTD
jgi:hypothetical protein